MRPRSETLFHFTKGATILEQILIKGFFPRFSLEDIRWLETNDQFLAYPMVCFCDIPLSRIGEHAAFYGSYGIGLTKRWALANSLVPVLYTPTNSAPHRLAQFLMNFHNSDQPKADDIREQIVALAHQLITSVKPLSGTMIINGTPVEKDFYQESEWRHIPRSRAVIEEKDFHAERGDENLKMEEHALQFTPNDVKYLFVKQDSEIPALVDFVTTSLGHFPHNDVKLLTTRILSLESLVVDI